MWRNGSFNMVYFGFYHSVKDYVPQFSDPTAEFCRKVNNIGIQDRILIPSNDNIDS